MNTKWWLEGLPETCSHFQMDLSCLVDGELDEVAACRAVEHLETCHACKDFLEDTRMQVRLHKDMEDPSRLLERYAALTGKEWTNDPSQFALIHELATIFYKLGKAYALSAMEPGYRIRVFEKAVEVESTRRFGRGFVDGVLARSEGFVELRNARHMLNGQLSKIEGALEKGKRLLQEAITVDEAHEEAQLWLALVNVHEGKHLRAEKAFTRVFDEALDEANRGHAAVQLGMLYFKEEEYKRAISYMRWLIASGLADRDERFFVVRFNIAMYYAHWRKPERSLYYFRQLLDRHPSRVHEVAGFIARAPKLRVVIDSQPGFGEALLEQCSELFQPTPQEPSPGRDGEQQ